MTTKYEKELINKALGAASCLSYNYSYENSLEPGEVKQLLRDLAHALDTATRTATVVPSRGMYKLIYSTGQGRYLNSKEMLMWVLFRRMPEGLKRTGTDNEG